MTLTMSDPVDEAEVDAALGSALADVVGVTPEEPGRREDTSAGKALALLDAFSGPLKVLGVTELATQTHLPKSTAHRLLAVLVARGYLIRIGDRYSLTEHVFEIGNQVRPCRPGGIRDRAMPYLSELFAQTRQTVHLAVLCGTEVLYLEKLFGHDAPRCSTSVGDRRPAYATALGKAILAFSDHETLVANLNVPLHRYTPYTLGTPGHISRAIERARRDGMAVDHEESQPGLHCAAAPILDPRTGRAVAAISVSSSRSSVDRQYGVALLRATSALSRHAVQGL